MIDADATFRSILVNHQPLHAVVGDRISASFIPQEDELPAIYYECVGGGPDVDLPIIDCEYEITVFAETPKQASDIYRLVQARLGALDNEVVEGVHVYEAIGNSDGQGKSGVDEQTGFAIKQGQYSVSFRND